MNASHPIRRKILYYKDSRQSLLGIGRLFLMSGINIDCNGHKHCDKSKDICPCYHKHHPFRKARIGMEARPPTSHENTLCAKKPLVRQDQGGFLLFIKKSQSVYSNFALSSTTFPRIRTGRVSICSGVYCMGPYLGLVESRAIQLAYFITRLQVAESPLTVTIAS